MLSRIHEPFHKMELGFRTFCTGLRDSTVAPVHSSHVAPRLRDVA
jgi:hypothetical protein